MRRPRPLSQCEAKARRELLLAVGRGLREAYDVTQPLPDRLRDLMERVAQAERDTQRT